MRTLLQARIERKTNEIPVAKLLLPTLIVSHRVYTADALHTHIGVAKVVVVRGES